MRADTVSTPTTDEIWKWLLFIERGWRLALTFSRIKPRAKFHSFE